MRILIALEYSFSYILRFFFCIYISCDLLSCDLGTFYSSKLSESVLYLFDELTSAIIVTEILIFSLLRCYSDAPDVWLVPLNKSVEIVVARICWEHVIRNESGRGRGAFFSPVRNRHLRTPPRRRLMEWICCHRLVDTICLSATGPCKLTAFPWALPAHLAGIVTSRI